jgi:hypothetical protein
MTAKIRNRQEPSEQREPPERVRHQPADPQPFQDGFTVELEDLEETLVADARSGLRPSQMVDRKLLALLGGGHPGLHIQAKGRPGDVRRAPGK